MNDKQKYDFVLNDTKEYNEELLRRIIEEVDKKKKQDKSTSEGEK